MTRPFVRYIVDVLSELGEVRSRAMFGGHGIYCDGLMIGLIASGQFYLKVDDGNRGDFEAEGSEPFTYHRKGRKEPVAMSYWEVPVNILENRDRLCQWARAAQVAALRAKAKRGKR